MFMLCAFAMTLRTDKAVEEGGSILQKVSKPAPKPAPATTPALPQSNTPTHDALPAGQQPATQTPATTPQSSNPPATQQQPASSQPAPAPTKKP